MLSSILLLLVLQFLWLRSSYYNAYDDLHKETNALFRNTVIALRDSIIERSIQPMPHDTVIRRGDRVDVSGPMPDQFADSMFERLPRERVSQVQIILSEPPVDSMKRMIKPLASKFYNYHGRNGKFILRLGVDSLKIDSIETHFSKVLKDAGIDLPFHVELATHGERMETRRGGLIISEQVRINPLERYSVTLAGVGALLLRKIVPQILFCAFLTLLTIGSFYLIYRSFRNEQRMTELKNDFIGNVTHELKTPITTVKVALEALKDFNGLSNPQTTREYIEIAQNELNRLAILTDKVLKTAIFERNGVSFQAEPVDLGKLTEQVLASMRLVFEKSGAAVSVAVEGEGFVVYGSPEHLTNVLYNLLDNALKYSPGHPAITILLKSNAGLVTLSVADRGTGIPEEYHKKVFEKFFRVPTGDVHNVKGYGLGLSYVASVIKSHRGNIVVESTPGEGAKFIVTLPV